MGNDTEQRAYRALISDFADMAPSGGFKNACDLPGLCPEDLSLVARVKPEPLRETILADIRTECERRNEQAHERQLEDFYGSSAPQSERERQMSAYGLRERDFR